MHYTKTRNPFHDYRSRCIYLVTINKAPGVEDFSYCFKRDTGHGRWTAHVGYRPYGRVIRDCLKRISSYYPQARPLHYIIMPDHIHFVLENKEDTGLHIGEVIGRFTGDCTRSLEGKIIFEPGYHDRILRYEGQLQRMIRYIDDNPRRLIIKREHPEYFHQPFIIELWGKEYKLYGNYYLLRNPDISAVRLSRKYTESQLMALHQEWEETIISHGVLASPFISPREKEWEKRGIEEGAGVILITREEFRERYKPSGRLFDLCADGRLLLISTGKSRDEAKLTRQEALAMNELAERIAGGVPYNLSLRRL